MPDFHLDATARQYNLFPPVKTGKRGGFYPPLLIFTVGILKDLENYTL
jgi:hypothetical protein